MVANNWCMVHLSSRGLLSAFYKGAAGKYTATTRVPSLGGPQQQIRIGAARGEEGNRLNFRRLTYFAIMA